MALDAKPSSARRRAGTIAAALEGCARAPPCWRSACRFRSWRCAPSRTWPTSSCCSRAGAMSPSRCALAFAGAAALSPSAGLRAAPPRRRIARAATQTAGSATCASPSIAGVVVLLLYPFLVAGRSPGRAGAIKWIDNFGIQILIYVMLGWGLNIVVGLAGLLDLGYVAFYAVGAYAFALLAQHYEPRLLGLPAAGRHPGGLLGRPARLSGAAAARRLSGHRHAGIRRDHPPRADQLGRPHPRLCRHFRRAARDASSACRSTTATRASPPSSASSSPRPPHDLSLLRDPRPRRADQLGDAAPAPPARRPRLGSAARGRDRLPLARHQHHQHQAHRVRARRHVRRVCRRVLRRAARASSRRRSSRSWRAR